MLIAGIITKILIRTVTKNSELFTRVIIGILIYSTIIGGFTFNDFLQQDTPILGGLFHTNIVISLLEMYIYIISILLISFLIGRKEFIAEYRIILGFSILGMITLIESFDIFSTFLAIELQSLSLYVITTITRKTATAAGLKYFLLGSLSSAIFLLGLVLIYSLTGITQYDGFNILTPQIYEGSEYINSDSLSYGSGIFGYLTVAPSGPYENNYYINIALILITIGLLLKIGAAPFHNWAPDVYDNTPTLITSWLAIMGKISILSFLFILKTTGIFAEALESLTLITLSAILSLIIGSILGLVQYKIKRLLAYSSISHLGFLLIALSIDNALAVSSFLFYMFQYWISLISMFAILIYYEHQGSYLHNLSSLQYIKFNPALVTALIVTIFSLTGIPPLIGFFGKQMILYISLLNGNYIITTIAILTSVISAAYYLKIVKTSFTGRENQSLLNQAPISSLHNLSSSSRILSWIISIITLIILLFFINTTLLLDFTHNFAVYLA